MARPPHLPDDAELIQRLLANDQAAYLLVVKTYHGLMIQIARAIIGEAFAEEVVQDAWLAMSRGLAKFERRSSFKTWLMRIVSNTAKSRLRKESRQINMGDFTPDDIPLIDPSRFDQHGHWSNPPKQWNMENPEALLSSRQLEDCLDKTIGKLPDMQQAVLGLRDNQDLEIEHICKILELSESNVRVLLHRARSRLRNTIERYQEDGTC